MPENGRVDHIAELEKKLYARDPSALPPRQVGVLRPLKNKFTDAWGRARPTIPKHRSVATLPGYKKFFIFSVIFLLFSGGVLGYSVLYGSRTISAKNVDFAILGNAFVPAGEELPLEIEIANRNTAPLMDAVLTLEYPKGVGSGSTGEEMVRLTRELGQIESGRERRESVQAVLYGEEGATRSVRAVLEYRIPNARSPFTKEALFPVVISAAPIDLSIDAPEASPANQPFSLSISVSLEGSVAPEDLALRVEYPTGFRFQSATPAPISGNNLWSLKTITTQASESIRIEGVLSGESLDEKSFRAYVGSRDKENPTKLAVTYSSMLHTVLLDQPFLEARISVGERQGGMVVLDRNVPISGSIEWKNNIESELIDPEIVLFINSTLVDEASIRSTGGFYDSRRRAIVWNKETAPSFSTLEPGASGSFDFSFKPSTPAGARPGDIFLSLSIRGETPELGFESKTIDAADRVTIRFTGAIRFEDALRYAGGPIKNSGPLPPKADTPTTYSVVWTVRPGDTAVHNARAEAKLPFYVSWAGVIVPGNETVVFNPDTKVVSWDIGTIPQSVGTAQSRTVSFQLSLTPSRSQIGDTLTLVEAARIEGIDSGTKTLLQLTRPALTTEMVDGGNSKGGGAVAP